VGKTPAKGVTLSAVDRDRYELDPPTEGNFSCAVGGAIVHNDHSGDIFLGAVDDLADGTLRI
jgi:hypothetical protein